jgi:GT2 family glycosyltransferase
MTASDPELALAMLRDIEQKLQAGVDVSADFPDLLRTMRLVLESSGRAVEELRGQCERLLAHQKLLDERLLRVETNRLFRLWTSVVLKTRQVYRQVSNILLRSPAGEGSVAEYVRWVNHVQATVPSAGEHRKIAATWGSRPLISIIMPVFRLDERWLAEALDSVRAQSYENWQLCMAANGSQPERLMRVIKETADAEPRIRFTTLPQPQGIGAASNAAVILAQGEYLGFLDDGDVLSPFALHSAVESIQDADADLIYSDEDRLDSAGTRVQPIFKPDWSPTLLRSCNYVGRFLVVRRAAFESAGGFRGQSDRDQNHDLALRITAQHARVHHLARVLYHRRTDEFSRSILGAKSHSAEACQQPSEAESLAVSIIICSKTPRLIERCVNSVRRTVRGIPCEFLAVHHEDGAPDHGMRHALTGLGVKVVPYRGAFHFSRMNNMGAARATAPYLLFLNDDFYATRAGWCEGLLGQLQQPGVGIAGALLRYPSGEIQHAGVVVGVGDCAGHPGRFRFASNLWPWLTLTRDVSAVTGACMAVRADVFQQLGGFDPGFPINYNDVDLCLRAGAAGYRVVCVAAEGLFHDECRTRLGVTYLGEREAFYQRWMEVLRRPDPYYSAALRPTEEIALNCLDSPTSRWQSPLRTSQA